MNTSLRHLVLGLLLIAPVATAQAQTPALTPIADVTLNADATLTVNVVAIDQDGGEVSLSSSLPSFATLNSPRIGVGQVVTTLTLSPSGTDVGTYTAAVTATAGGISDTQIFEITVNPAGTAAAPVVSSPALREVEFDANLAFSVQVADPDGTGIASLSAPYLPPGASFTPDAGNTSGAFSWTPTTADAGEYDVEFIAASTNGTTASSTTHIRVIGPPSLAIQPIEDVTAADGSFVSVAVHVSGLPGETIELTASLPSFAMLNPPGSGTGSVNTTITVAPPLGSAGTYRASVSASSGGEFVTELFDIIVTGGGPLDNYPPVIFAPATSTVAAGSNLNFLVTATDPDGDPVDLFGSALPPGASFVDNGDNTGTFSWDPAPGDEGIYLASFSGLDNRGGSGAASTQITVTGTGGDNRPPTVIAPPTAQGPEGTLITFAVTATDPDGDPVTLMADQLPAGAGFDDLGNGSGSFSWTPAPGQAGVYEVAFTGNDGSGGTGTASTVVTVDPVGGPGPCLITGDPDVCEGEFAELCGPDGAQSYLWAGPYGFTADTPCIQVDVAGLYELTVVNADQSTSSCSVVVTLHACDFDVSNCPRGPGFWKAQCDQKGNGSTKFTASQMDEITACVDEASSFFAWANDFGEFCAVVDPPRPMDIRKQTLRMYAVMLANICAGRLGTTADDGHAVSLDPATLIEDPCIDGVLTIADLMDETEMRLVELEGLPLGPEVREAYGQLKDCLERVNEGEGIGPTCKPEDDHGDCDHDDDGGGDRDDDGDGDHDDGDHGDGDQGDGDHSDDDHGSGDDDHGSGDHGSGDLGGQGGQSRNAQGAQDFGLDPVVSPNPLNPNTELSFYLSGEGPVRVTIYDVQGRLVKTLMDEYRGSGEQRVRWDGSSDRGRTVPSGVYFIRIQTPQGEATRRATVLK